SALSMQAMRSRERSPGLGIMNRVHHSHLPSTAMGTSEDREAIGRWSAPADMSAIAVESYPADN
ncbi:hypothetical protein, partial [Paraburkholderia sp. SIMBA_027]|uniref:hypothetical protein n=1 Tax=Paraburkholderia sp. SIMBA_027 TaxID=3085770 RepID=UPI00397A6BE1